MSGNRNLQRDDDKDDASAASRTRTDCRPPALPRLATSKHSMDVGGGEVEPHGERVLSPSWLLASPIARGSSSFLSASSLAKSFRKACRKLMLNERETQFLLNLGEEELEQLKVHLNTGITVTKMGRNGNPATRFIRMTEQQDGIRWSSKRKSPACSTSKLQNIHYKIFRHVIRFLFTYLFFAFLNQSILLKLNVFRKDNTLRSLNDTKSFGDI